MILLKKKKTWYYILFLFFLIIFFLSPISGDDWGNYLVGSQGLRHMVGNAIGMYFSWEGRFASRLLINLLTYNKWLWNITNSIVLVSIVFLIQRIYPFKNKKLILLLTILLILFMNIFTFSQVVVWIAGNITYLFVIPLILLVIKLLYKKHKFNSKTTAILIFLHAIIPMFVEHMAIILICLDCIFLGVDYLKHKKLNKKLLLFLVISISSFLVMFLSPGNRLRSGMENLAFNELSLFGKIIYNLPNFVLYTYIINTFLLVLIAITSIFLIKKQIKNKNIRLLLYLLEVPSLVLGVYYLLVRLYSFSHSIFNEWFVIVYYIYLTIIHFVLLIKNSKDIKKDLAILFYIIGILSNAVMLLSPTWGYRTSFATYLFLGISFIIVLDSFIKEKEWMYYSTVSLSILGMLVYVIFYINIHNAYQENYKRIKKARNSHATSIELIRYPEYAPCNLNPGNDYHLKKFKEYYKLDENVEIVLTDNHWKYMIIYNK